MKKATGQMRGRLLTAEAVRTFVLSANRTSNPTGAKLTLVSALGKRYTFGIRAGDRDGYWFVDGLIGPDNDADYLYLGAISATRRDRHFDVFTGAESVVDGYGFRRRTEPGQSVYALTPNQQASVWGWLWSRVLNGHMPDNVEVWHEGRCGRCGRTLTVESSIASGLGPVCARKVLE